MPKNKRGTWPYMFKHLGITTPFEDDFKVGQLVYIMKYLAIDRRLTFDFGMIVGFESPTLAEVLLNCSTVLVETEYLVSPKDYELLMQEEVRRGR